MSYCRTGEDSDVYLIKSGKDCWSLWWGRHNICTNIYSLKGVLEALHSIKELGYKVPQRAFDRVERELNDCLT